MLKQLKRKQKKKGFTLIELVIVLAVLAIIAMIAIPNFNKVRTDAQKKADDRTCDVITRITNMAIANEDIVVEGNGFILITPQETGEIPASNIKSSNVSAINFGDKDKSKGSYTAALKEVKKPQQKDRTQYKVTITNGDNGESVKTETVGSDVKVG